MSMIKELTYEPHTCLRDHEILPNDACEYINSLLDAHFDIYEFKILFPEDQDYYKKVLEMERHDNVFMCCRGLMDNILSGNSKVSTSLDIFWDLVLEYDIDLILSAEMVMLYPRYYDFKN